MMRHTSRVLTGLIGLLLVVSAATLAAADNKNNKGTIKVHDDPSAGTDNSNDPHVSCDFYIEGFKMVDNSGRLEFKSWPPTGDKSVVTPTGASLLWTADSGNAKDGYHFENGAYQLPPGHYRVQAFSDGGHPGNFAHSSKTKMFWVDECEEIPFFPGAMGIALGSLGLLGAFAIMRRK